MQKDDVIRAEGKSAAKLYMTDGEIVNSYRLARDPRRQIGVLAELNAVPPSVIREILAEAGELVLKPRKTGGGHPLGFDAAEAAEVREEAAQAEGGAVTVQRLCDLLRGAVDAGYGSVPVTVEGCRFAAMRLRVELLVESGLVFNGRPVKVELEGTPEVPVGKEE